MQARSAPQCTRNGLAFLPRWRDLPRSLHSSIDIIIGTDWPQAHGGRIDSISGTNCNRETLLAPAHERRQFQTSATCKTALALAMRRGDVVRVQATLLLMFFLVDAFLVHASNANYHDDRLHSHSRHRHPDQREDVGAECFDVIGDHNKFYLYGLKAEKLCYSGEELLERAQQQPPNHRQLLGAALFMRQQLEDHPSRTLDPSEATLFVLPAILDLAKMHKPAGCKASLKTILHSISEELAASPHFQRNHGRDHLIPFLSHRKKAVILKEQVGARLINQLAVMRRIPEGNFEVDDKASDLPSTADVLKAFRHTIRNMIIAVYCRETAMRHGLVVEKPMVPGEGTHRIRDMVVPFLAPGTIDSCEVQSGTIKIVCSNGYTGEETFEAYKESRNNTVFFIGNGWRFEQPHNDDVPGAGTSISKKRLRQLAIYGLEGLKWPSILADTSSDTPSKIKKKSPACDFDNGNVTTGCRIEGGIPPSLALHMMSKSLLSLHIRGDDASSSRVYEAVASGTPQLFLSSRMYQEAIPFKCAVPWGELYQPIDEMAFEKGPLETMEAILGELLGAEQGSERLRRMWNTQREASKDLLWHLPGSRVAHNMVEDAMRMVLLGLRERKHTKRKNKAQPSQNPIEI